MAGFADNYINALMAGAQDGNRARIVDMQATRQNALLPLEVQQAQIGMQAQRQGMAIDAERLAMAREAGKREAAAFAQDAARRAQFEQEFRFMQQGARAYEAARSGNPQAFETWRRMAGPDGEAITLETFPAYMATAEGGMEVLKGLTAAREYSNPPGPEPTAGMREYEFAVSQGFAGTFADWEQSNRRAGATSINMGGGSDKQVFDEMKASADAARSAAAGYASLSQAKAALEAGAITGFGADQRLYLQKLGTAIGITDPAAVENTETFRSAIAPQVAALMKATVGSTQISNADREFAEKAAGGSITLDEGTIKRLIGIMEKASRSLMEGHSQRLGAVYPEGGQFDRERALFNVPIPEFAQPPAVGSGSPQPGQAGQPWTDDPDLLKYGQ